MIMCIISISVGSIYESFPNFTFNQLPSPFSKYIWNEKITIYMTTFTSA